MKSEFERWLENKYNLLPRRERMDLLEKFYMDRYDQARYKNCVGGTYIPPSKLYDNPHYRSMSVTGKPHQISFLSKLDFRKPRHMTELIHNSKVTEKDELVFVLAELIKLDIEWNNLREFYSRRHDFDGSEIRGFWQPHSELGENELLSFFRKLEVFPSQEELDLFLHRYGKSQKVSAKSMEELVFHSNRGKPSHPLTTNVSTLPTS